MSIISRPYPCRRNIQKPSQSLSRTLLGSPTVFHAPSLMLNAYEVILSTQPFSSFLTSALNFSTSSQQSRGLLSLSRRHCTTPFLALSTSAGSSRTFFLSSSLRLSALTSLLMDWWEGPFVDEESGVLAIVSWALLRASEDCAWSFLSSFATRAWTSSSIAFARDASV
jgi:hypothetical protein